MIEFRITRRLLKDVHADLSRPHSFAAERVGFLACQVASTADAGLMILGDEWLPVADNGYEDDPSVGAMLNGAAFRASLQFAYRNKVSMFHVHRHEHYGLPDFSEVDLIESRRFMPDFWKVRPAYPHGTLVLSHDAARGLVWLPNFASPVSAAKISFEGYPRREFHFGPR